jgi:hypothetical protein
MARERAFKARREPKSLLTLSRVRMGAFGECGYMIVP